MKQSILISITIILIFIFVFINSNTNLTSIKLENGNIIMVRERFDKYESATLLDKLISNMYKLREILINNKDKDIYNNNIDYINLLEKNFNKRRTKIYENDLNSNHTSYSVNKGEEFVFCLRCKITKKLHNINLLTYVAVHGMAHAGCPEIGHTTLFNKIFKFYLQVAVNNNIYVYQNYSISPINYCGLNLHTNILN